MRNNTAIVAVPDMVGPAGVMTWWRLTGHVAHEKLRAAWDLEGLDDALLPPKTSMLTGLRRALRMYEGPSKLIRPIPGVNGYAVVEESFEKDVKEPFYKTHFSVWCEKDALMTDPPLSAEEGERLGKATEIAMQFLESTDLSSWLVAQTKEVQSVKLRDTGGIYFVPEHQASTWGQIADILRSISACEIYEVPALKTDKAVNAILAGLLEEAKHASARLAEELQVGDLGGRALKKRARVCDEMSNKLQAYEALLGVQLDEMKLQFEELDGRVAAAILASEAA